ncbi:ATPase [Clostridia bacterium]|nr:ATPase [Clostridia bacterium]
MFFDTILPLLAPLFLIASLVIVYQMKKRGKNPKTMLLVQIGAFFTFLVGSSLVGIGNVALAAEASTTASTDIGFGLIAAALSTGLAGIGGGIGVSGSAAAAIGAVSENASMFGKSLIFVALAEGIALYGLLISFMILGRI